MTPRTLLRTAALNALAAAANLAGTNPDFAPLVGAQAWLGQAWPTQSPPPGSGPMPNQVLIYIWDEKSHTVSDSTTSPQFNTTAMLVIEARVEVRAQPATSALPETPTDAAILNAVDSVLDGLTYAVKEAICGAIQVAAMNLNGGNPVIQSIQSIEIADKLAETGQRIAGNGVVTVDLVYGETFGQIETMPPLTDLSILTGTQAGGFANAGNTGNGTISAVVPGLGVQAGDYAVLFTSATDYAVTAPDGSATGTGTAGASFAAGGLNFTITAGPQAFAAGDGFTIVVQPVATAQYNLAS